MWITKRVDRNTTVTFSPAGCVWSLLPLGFIGLIVGVQLVKSDMAGVVIGAALVSLTIVLWRACNRPVKKSQDRERR